MWELVFAPIAEPQSLKQRLPKTPLPKGLNSLISSLKLNPSNLNSPSSVCL